MSIVANFIEAELKKAEIFSDTAKVGFVTHDTTTGMRQVVVAHSRNARSLFNDLLPSASLTKFDAQTLFDYDGIRKEICLGYAQLQGLEQHGIKPETVQFDVSFESIKEQTKYICSPALAELGADEKFLTRLSYITNESLAQKLRDYAATEGKKPLAEKDISEASAFYDGQAEIFSTRLKKMLGVYLNSTPPAPTDPV